LLNLLLIIDVDHDPAEMARSSLLAPYDAAARANPLARLRSAVDVVLHVETAAGLDRLRYGLPGASALFRVKKGKEQFVSKGQVPRNAKERSGRIRPKQPVRRKVQIPHANAGSFDTQPKTLVSNGIVGCWMYDGGHVPPLLPGIAEEYQDARWQATALQQVPVGRIAGAAPHNGELSIS
jgi:hypothetical protein